MLYRKNGRFGRRRPKWPQIVRILTPGRLTTPKRTHHWTSGFSICFQQFHSSNGVIRPKLTPSPHLSIPYLTDATEPTKP